MRLWDASTGQHKLTVKKHTPSVYSVAFSPDGNTLATGSDVGATVRLWDTSTGEQQAELKGHAGSVRSVAFSPDGNTLATGSWDGTVLLWDLPSTNTSDGVAVEPLSLRPTTLGDIKQTELLQNFPNPFNPETWIPYQLANDALVTVDIYDQSGHIVRALDIGKQKSGVYRAKTNAAYWDGRNQNGELVTSGTYYYQFRAGDYSASRRMVIVK